VIAALYNLHLAAFEECQISRKDGAAQQPIGVLDTAKPVGAGSCEMLGQVSANCEKDVYGKPLRARERLQRSGFPSQAPKNKRRGSNEREENELTVRPSRLFPSKVVTTVTPVAKRLIAARSSRRSIVCALP
jgi:hypothetical protein